MDVGGGGGGGGPPPRPGAGGERAVLADCSPRDRGRRGRVLVQGSQQPRGGHLFRRAQRLRDGGRVMPGLDLSQKRSVGRSGGPLSSVCVPCNNLLVRGL